MKSFKYTIKDPDGIHARPAGLLVKTAGKFQSKITLLNNERSGDAKGIFSVMGLNVKCGDEIEIMAEGPDEEEAIDLIGRFLEENL
ncbi:MAG: HPr family phosphocarrier protein [Clostridia bacterium]|nr:HPr family phosphocarrier protein [Clostridia bacterium]